MSLKHERQMIDVMVHLYCRKQHGKRPLCQDCQEILDYALARLGKCPFGENKPTCKDCPVHCYKPAMRKRMTMVMSYAGPRMMLYHPVLAIKHWLREKWGKQLHRLSR